MSTGIFCQGNFKFSLSLLEAVTASGAAAGITSATVAASAGIASASGAGAFRFRKRVGTDTLLGYLQLKPIGIKGSRPHFFFFDGHTPGYSQIQVVEQEARSMTVKKEKVRTTPFDTNRFKLKVSKQCIRTYTFTESESSGSGGGSDSGGGGYSGGGDSGGSSGGGHSF